uniref:Uncharacterized protein n=1 Tax=Mustela putorius furo TaxID=9669 RepID=M3YZ19_MUSPF
MPPPISPLPAPGEAAGFPGASTSTTVLSTSWWSPTLQRSQAGNEAGRERGREAGPSLSRAPNEE